MNFFLGILPSYKAMGFYFGGLQNGKSVKTNSPKGDQQYIYNYTADE